VHSQSSQVRLGSVSQDWRNPLGNPKTDAYVRCVQKLEIAYTMFSVSLDEAFGLQRNGRVVKAQQVLTVCPALCHRLSVPLQSLLRSMYIHARHFAITPNVLPLNPENFQNARSQRVARFNELFSKVLLTRRSQFVNKISTLEDLVLELSGSFGATADELMEDQSVQPERDWETLDALHYDLNTCLRETAVLYKSFLHALPEGQLASFESTLKEHCAAADDSIPARARHLAHRRMAFLKGQ